jgi:glyoxylase-like metal-dependent hydrolase (beta-lactamase superfamily II)
MKGHSIGGVQISHVALDVHAPYDRFTSVDSFVAPAWPRLKQALDGLGDEPVKCVIDTHWHFDHTDNNAALHAVGATVLARENTEKRLSRLEGDALTRDTVLAAGRRAAYFLADVAPEGRAKGLSA